MKIKGKLSVVFRVDADERLGLGHLSRARSLMLALSAKVACKFSVATNSSGLVREFLLGVDVDLLSPMELSGAKLADIVIVDVPNIGTQVGKSLQGLANLLVVIDDDGPGLAHQDVLVRPNLLNLPLPAGMSLENYWSGRDFIILHPEFARLARQSRSGVKKVKELLVCFGGSDPSGLTSKILPALRQLSQDVTTHVILGAAYSQAQNIMAQTRDDQRFVVTKNSSDMAQRIMRADVAIVSGGTLLYEVCALGTPAVIISQNDAQIAEAGICAAVGAVVSLGDVRTARNEDVLATIDRLLNDNDLRRSMSHMGKATVSAMGAEHIASRLLLRTNYGARV